MKDRQLKYFCAIVDAGSTALAASRLFVAPTAISTQINLLEKELGGVLFDRSKRPMSLTPLGMFFYPRAKELLAANQRLREEASSIAAGKRGWISVAFVRSTIFSLLPTAMRAFRNALPEVQIDLLELLSEFQPAQLRSGRVDVGVVRLLGEEEYLDDLQQTVLIDDPFVAVFPAHHRMTHRESISLAELEGLPYISYPKNPQTHFSRRLTARIANAGVHMPVAQDAVEIHTALALVAADMGVTLVGASVATNNRSDIRFVRLADCGFTSQLVALTRTSDESAPVRTFVSALKDAAGVPAQQAAR
ncbi:LysR family transcriptional regulator [Enterovirga sp.]|uniref:LysR family transcriptional regulator n=1 Tax=Enterovirga sp. TaxID=2026350 RepID=UPI002BCEBFE4|nr:LysR family transcriptional regulator [Enterovirga sp.]HMO30969.1 LysR family transcriptional regulator [Enterovirga sp.]